MDASLSSSSTKKKRNFLLILAALVLLTITTLLQSNLATTVSLEKYQGVLEAVISSPNKPASINIHFTVEHRTEVRQALEKLMTQAPHNATTEVQQTDGTKKIIDLTKNFPRIEDYPREQGSPVQRQIHPPTETEEVTEKKDPLNIVIFYADDWTMKVRTCMSGCGRGDACCHVHATMYLP